MKIRCRLLSCTQTKINNKAYDLAPTWRWWRHSLNKVNTRGEMKSRSALHQHLLHTVVVKLIPFFLKQSINRKKVFCEIVVRLKTIQVASNNKINIMETVSNISFPEVKKCLTHFRFMFVKMSEKNMNGVVECKGQQLARGKVHKQTKWWFFLLANILLLSLCQYK